MTVQVLISCMHQKDAGIIRRSNIQSDVVVINQCNENRREDFTFRNRKGEECKAIVIYTTERGLSRSRNMNGFNFLTATTEKITSVTMCDF